MVRTIETTAKTTEDAILAAVRQLGVSRDEVTVEELQKPKSGFFGIGSVEAKVRVTYTLKPAERAVEFLKGTLTRMGVEASIDASTAEDGSIALNISGENMGVVIGRRGDTLDALQYITSIAVNRGEADHIKVTLDTENYRKKREESLENLAHKVAARVLKYRRNVTLEPMSSYERRVIHAALQNVRGITTYSTGSDPNRRVVVALQNGASNRTSAPRGRQGKPSGSAKASVDETV